jgi:hypothetical protein
VCTYLRSDLITYPYFTTIPGSRRDLLLSLNLASSTGRVAHHSSWTWIAAAIAPDRFFISDKIAESTTVRRWFEGSFCHSGVTADSLHGIYKHRLRLQSLP